MKYRRIIFVIWCHYIFEYVVNAFPKRIPIGAIFDGHLAPAITAFRYELEKHNNSSAAFKLDKYEELVSVEHSQDVTTKICQTMFKGIFAFLGVTETTTMDSVASYSGTFHMPYVSTSVPSNNTFISSSYILHMRPSYARAVIDIIRHYKWAYIFYVYEGDEGMWRLLKLLEIIRRDNLKIRIDATRLLSVNNCYATLRQLDARRTDGDKYIVLDMSTEDDLKQILRQILHVGMNRASYHYLLGGLAMDELDLSDFQHGGVNITGFRLVNPEIPKVAAVQRNWSQLNHIIWKGAGKDRFELEVALTMDAVTVIANGLSAMLQRDSDVFRGVFRRGQVYNNKTRGVQCFTDVPSPWKHGKGIYNAFKGVAFKGVTGQVAFDEDGFRKDYALDIMELSLNNQVKKVGTWRSIDNRVVIDRNKSNIGEPPPRGNKTRIITSIATPPYLMLKKKPDANGEPLVGNEKYEGYCAELAKEIARLCEFDYLIQPVKDNKYGTLQDNGKWDGMVAELTNKEADLAIAPLTINSKRERVIDFSKPFMRLGISIMIKKPEKQKPGVFSFMDPLSKDIWMCIIVAYLGVSIVLFLVSRFSPYEWQIEDSVNGPSFTNDFTLLNSLWFSLGAFMQQGCDISPRSLSGRIVGSVWWFFTLILISSYTANLAAFLTVERMLTPIESADDLAEQTEIQYGTLSSGSTQDFFKFSTVPVYERMWNFMSAQEPSVFTSSTREGVQRVRDSKGKYAFLLESTMNEYHNQKKPCTTMKVGGDLDSKGYGIATPLHSDLRERINLAVLKLQESGFLQKLKKKWWYDKGECAAENDGGGSSQSALTLSNVAGIFYILIGGLGLSMIVSLLEFLYKSKVEARRQKSGNGGLYSPTQKALANSFRQKARMSARGTPEHENGGYSYSAPSQIIKFDHTTDSYVDGSHTQV